MNALSLNGVRRFAAAVALVATAAAGAEAQDPAQISVLVRMGAQSFDKAASMDQGAFVGLDVMYGVNSWLSIGPALSIGRTQATGSHFISSLTYGIGQTGDTTTFHNSTQPITLLDGALNARVRMMQDRALQPYATAGVGGYVQFLDPVVMRGDRRQTGMQYNIGAGLLYQLSDRAGIALDVRAFTLMNYDRTEMDPRDNVLTNARVERTLFREDFPLPPATKSSVTNFSMSLAFSYVPSFLGGGGR